MSQYIVSDSYGHDEITAASDGQVIEIVERWLRESAEDAFCADPQRGTMWLSADIHRKPTVAEGDDPERFDDEWNAGYVATVEVDVDPSEPECTAAEHDWRDPRALRLPEHPVVGHGGGVITCDVCAHCGTVKLTDTWAQNPENGAEGLVSISYQPYRFRDRLALDSAERDET